LVLDPCSQQFGFIIKEKIGLVLWRNIIEIIKAVRLSVASWPIVRPYNSKEADKM
jgi:hypothetical protein